MHQFTVDGSAGWILGGNQARSKHSQSGQASLTHMQNTYRSVPAKRPWALNLSRLISRGVGAYLDKWALTKRPIDKWAWLQNTHSVTCVAMEQEKEATHS